jgi:3-hydroxyisobutyrate dehydrogenase
MGDAMTISRLGFIGLGTMGGPMCENLLRKSGLTVHAYDIEPGALRRSVENGANAASGAAEIARLCEAVFTMLPKDEHVSTVYGELVPHMREGQIFVEMSTISPRTSISLSKEAANKGAHMLDAPVVKSRAAAVDGKLGIYVGGDPGAYEKIRPFLAYMGENIIHLGGNGAGLVMKLCHNLLVAQIQNGVNETLALAKKAGGIDAKTFAEAVSYGGGKNLYLELKAQAIASGDYTPAFAAEYMDKDIRLARQLCAENGLSLEGADLAGKMYAKALEAGFGKEDFSSLYKLFE